MKKKISKKNNPSFNGYRKFTIVIPTRDRADTLIYSIQNALAQDYENFEILVSDNASNDNTKKVVLEFNDKRIRYINTGKRVSMSHNWEFALDHVSDGWVTLLGDDDGLLPGALKTVNKIIDETDTQAIRSNGSTYAWPSLHSEEYGRLTLSLKKGYKKVDSKKTLTKVMNGELQYNNLPVLYNGGFVDICLINEVKVIMGRFFHSMAPDVYSGIVFSLLIDEYIYSNEPLAINGASHHSTGTAGYEKNKRKREYNPSKMFYTESNIQFHKDLPLLSNGAPVSSLQAVVYECYLQAAPFHKKKNLTVLPEKQLKIIFMTAYPHYDEVYNWGRCFAKLHDINYEKILQNSLNKKSKFLWQLKKGELKFNNFLSTFYLNGNKNLPLKNILQASIVLSDLKSINPGLLKRVINILTHIKKIY